MDLDPTCTECGNDQATTGLPVCTECAHHYPWGPWEYPPQEGTTTMTEHQGPRPDQAPQSQAQDTTTRDVLHHDAITTDPAEVVQLGPNQTPADVVDEDDTTQNWPGPVPPNANDGDRAVTVDLGPQDQDDDEDDHEVDEDTEPDPDRDHDDPDDDDEDDDTKA